ncbi:unnamed protein product [Chrysoparadoxa australica]
MGWNGCVEKKVIAWDIKRSWEGWVEKCCGKARAFEGMEPGYFDHFPPAAAPSESASEGRYKLLESLSAKSAIKTQRQWALRRRRCSEEPHALNQEVLGQDEEVLLALVELCNLDDWEVVRNAVSALSIAAYHSINGIKLCEVQGCIQVLVRHCHNSDVETQSTSAAGLANIGYHSQAGQALIGVAGGVEALLKLCR